MKNSESGKENRTRRRQVLLPVGLVLLQSLLYGFGDPITKEAFAVMPVFSMLTIRYSIAFAVLMLLFGKRIITDLRNSSAREWLAPCVCVALTYILNNIALALTAATSVALLQCTCPVMTAVFSYFLLGETLSLPGVLGTAIILLCVMAGLLWNE